MGEITFGIKENVGIIEHYHTGWNKEVNIVSWNGCTDKYDIRDWSPDHEHMSRGITLHEDEAKKLYEILKNRFEDAEA